MKFLALLMFFNLSISVHAGDFSEDPSRMSTETLMKQGRLVSISLSLGNPMRIFVSGREEAKIDLSKMKLTVRRLAPYPAQEMRVNKEGHFYTVVNTHKEPLKEIEITTSVYEDTESFQFKIQNTKQEKK